MYLQVLFRLALMQKTLIIIIFWSLNGLAQQPKQLNSSEIYQKMTKLNVLGKVLYLAAHPDDENTRFISYCANEKLFSTAYLSLTRGDGGQNLIGTEIREELGIIRTQELLAARRIDGGQQFFSRANDFGYSKTPEETLAIWDKAKVLADVVWVIRQFRPDVIVCRFPSDGGGGHGHHTSSALLAQEAFEIAGDKAMYPEQLEYVDVWQATRVVVNTGRWWNDSISAEDDGVVAHDIGVYNQRLGLSYNELAARSRTMHKSQGFGSTGSRGEHIEFFEHIKGLKADSSLFEGYDRSWNKFKGGAEIEKQVKQMMVNYNVADPSLSIAALINIRNLLKELEDENWKEIKLKELDELVFQCAGIYIEAIADDYSKCIGDSLYINFELLNRSDVNVKLLRLKSPALSYDKVRSRVLIDNEKINETFSCVLPTIPISQPYWLAKKGTLGTYNVEDQQLIGQPENEFSVAFDAIIEIEGEQLTYKFPLIYKWNDPVKGELYRPFIITPKTTVNIEQPIYLFSSKEAQEITLSLKANTDNQTGEFKVIATGGWSLTYEKAFNLLKKVDESKVVIRLSPMESPQDGLLELYINKEPSKSLNTISYDHIPVQVWFPNSTAQLVYVSMKKSGEKIGYLLGAGDVVPEALANIGYNVDLLTETDLNLDNLKQYDAILTGVRFFNVNERSPYIAPKLMKYVENGGNLVVQYNTRHRMKTQDFGPYPIRLSRDRVTEENAQVTFLAPEHRVLNYPNKIKLKDFDNWVQERGLYFPDKWDDKYEAILSWHDKNEDAKEGSLLIAQYGKGTYVYTGISFFRELPAGVPGAYRLLVNLISLDNE